MIFSQRILKIYPWLFGLLALCLPFQTRFLVSVGIREAETIALYAFDLIFAALLLLNLIFGSKKDWCLALGWFLALWLFLANRMNLEMYWWLRFAEAATLGYLIYQKKEMATQPILVGFIFGMLISSFLGMTQIWFQEIVANKWLGISSQLPWQAGVSVLETEVGRLLRSYGSFPHPNIFGGFTALAIILFLSTRHLLPNWLKSRSIAFAAITILTIGLWSSFSRSAVLGLIVGLAILIYQKKISVRWVIWIGILAILLNGIWYQFSFDRVAAHSRLEEKSLNERAVAAKTAVMIIRAHPWFGVGLGNFTAVASQILKNNDPRYIEPVHNVYILILGEVGMAGAIIIILSAVRIFRRLESFIYPALGVILIVSLFDHYWWTTASARLALFMIIALAVSLKKATQVD